MPKFFSRDFLERKESAPVFSPVSLLDFAYEKSSTWEKYRSLDKVVFRSSGSGVVLERNRSVFGKYFIIMRPRTGHNSEGQQGGLMKNSRENTFSGSMIFSPE